MALSKSCVLSLISKAPKIFLDNPEFLRRYIEKMEVNIKKEQAQLTAELQAEQKEKEELPLILRPMDAPYWRKRQEKINEKKRRLVSAKKSLQNLK